MKNNIKALFILLLLLFAADTISAKIPVNQWIDPHDSLLFDGEALQSVNLTGFADNLECYTKVVDIKGKATGKVLKREIGIFGCSTVIETVYVAVEKFLEKGDLMMPSSEVLSGPASKVELGIYLMESGFNSVYLSIGPSSQLTLPSFTSCKVRIVEKEVVPEETITVIKGVVTYEPEKSSQKKVKTVGKRSSVIHTKTRYSHEVLFQENDTVDVIRVYEGSVEVTVTNMDAADNEKMSQEMEKLSEDMLAGKLTAEELQAKMTEFQSFGENLSDLIKPLTVDEGSKCTITKKSRIVEPLGTDDADKDLEK